MSTDTEKLTVNRNDWSGETITVRVDRENLTWEQYGDEFQLELVEFPGIDDDPELVDLIGRGYYVIRGTSWPPDYELGQVFFENDRGDFDPIAAAVQIVCNRV